MATTTSTASVTTKRGSIRDYGSAVIAANADSIVSATVLAPEDNPIRQAGATVAARVNEAADIEVYVSGPVGAGTIDVVIVTEDA